MKKFKVAIAGYGIVGKRRRSFIESHPNLELVAICDRAFATCSPPADNLEYYSTPEKLLSCELDILFVALSNTDSSL